MTIWILALILLGCLAGIGYQQGAIRVAVSFVGIIVAALLAGPLGKPLTPVIKGVGVANPVLLWVLPPFVAFLIILTLFKVGGYALHHKIEVFYRYKAGDLRFALWERLNAHLGLCLGTLNALAYLVLISMVIYPFSYWTVQLASPSDDPNLVKIFNRMGRDLQSTGMAKVARAVDPMPDVFYSAADAAGLIYQNPLLEARLSRYPAFLSLSERPDFQAIARDKSFSEARLQQKPIREILKNPNVQAITKPDVIKYIWDIVSPDLNDLTNFLSKGTSAKYTNKILGRWYFDPSGAMAAYLRSKPGLQSSEVAKARARISTMYSKTMMIVYPDHKAVIKDLPHVRPAAAPNQSATLEFKDYDGKWEGKDGEYLFKFGGGGGERQGTLEADRLILTGDIIPLAFNPED